MGTEADAVAFSLALSHPGAPRVVEVGDLLEEEPCVNLEAYRSSFPGRECPRVDLEPENEEAATLVQMRLAEDPLAPAYFEAACGGLPPEERKRVLLRVMRAVGDPRVQSALKVNQARHAESPEPEAPR